MQTQLYALFNGIIIKWHKNRFYNAFFCRFFFFFNSGQTNYSAKYLHNCVTDHLTTPWKQWDSAWWSFRMLPRYHLTYILSIVFSQVKSIVYCINSEMDLLVRISVAATRSVKNGYVRKCLPTHVLYVICVHIHSSRRNFEQLL